MLLTGFDGDRPSPAPRRWPAPKRTTHPNDRYALQPRKWGGKVCAEADQIRPNHRLGQQLSFQPLPPDEPKPERKEQSPHRTQSLPLIAIPEPELLGPDVCGPTDLLGSPARPQLAGAPGVVQRVASAASSGSPARSYRLRDRAANGGRGATIGHSIQWTMWILSTETVPGLTCA